MQIYAVRVFVRNWDAACAFYEEQLGLPLRFASADLGWAEFDVGGPSIAVERATEETAALIGRFLGVSLLVENMEATQARLEQAGVQFVMSPEVQFWGGQLAHLQDPEGNVLTLLAY